MTEFLTLFLLKLFRRFRGISLYLLRKLYDHIIQNSIHTTMDFLQDITGALLETVEFNNDEREQLVETLMTKTAAVATSAVKFQTAIGEDPDGVLSKGGKSLIKLAGKLGTKFASLTPEQTGVFKELIADIYENPSPDIDAAGQNLFNDSIDAIAAAQALSDYENAQA